MEYIGVFRGLKFAPAEEFVLKGTLCKGLSFKEREAVSRR
jgi:hypothetical protein